MEPGLIVGNLALKSNIYEPQELDTWITVKQGCSLIGITKQSLCAKIKKGFLITRKTTGNGGQQYEILLSSLIENLQVEKKVKVAEKIKAVLPVENKEISLTGEKSFDSEEWNLALAKADLINFYLEASRTAKEKLKAKHSFITGYNSGNILQKLYSQIGEVSFKSLERWTKDYLSGNRNPESLLRRYKMGVVSVSKNEADLLIKEILCPNKIPHAEAVRKVKENLVSQGFINLRSDRTYLRFIDKWVKDNYDVYKFSRDGYKAFNDTVLTYLERDPSLIKAGDVCVIDGHDLNFTILDPKSGKPKRMTLILCYDMYSSVPLGFEIMPTENTAAIASAIRRTLIMTGFRMKVIYLDNGKAFRGKFFRGCEDFRQSGLTGLFDRLGVVGKYAIVRNAQSKTVERFFGKFAEFERSLPFYTGNSIQNKPARLLQGEKYHKNLFDKYYSNTSLTVKEALLLIMNWFENYVNRPLGKTAFFAGRTPAELYKESIEIVKAEQGFYNRAITKDEVDFLMMSERIVTLDRNGVRLDGRHYFNEALYGLKKKVIVKYDELYDDEVLVYDYATGKRICKASCKELVHPMAFLSDNEEDKKLVKQQLELKRHLVKKTVTRTKEITEGTLYYPISGEFTQQENLEEKKPKQIKKKTNSKDREALENYWLNN